MERGLKKGLKKSAAWLGGLWKMREHKKASGRDGEKNVPLPDNVSMTRIVLLFLAGIFLLLLSMPSGNGSGKKGSMLDNVSKKKADEALVTESAQDTALSAMGQYAAAQEKELEEVLSQVDGVGEVDVMLTVAASEEKKTLQKENKKQETMKEHDSAGGERSQSVNSSEADPVLVREGEEQIPYTVQVEAPRIEGVVVVAQGAGNAAVNAEIIRAVEALFPVEAHKIKVMKMSTD